MPHRHFGIEKQTVEKSEWCNTEDSIRVFLICLRQICPVQVCPRFVRICPRSGQISRTYVFFFEIVDKFVLDKSGTLYY